MTNKTYDILKWIAQLLLPAIATLYVALAEVWGLPLAKEVAGTISAVDVFLGAVLKVSSDRYNAKQNAETNT